MQLILHILECLVVIFVFLIGLYLVYGTDISDFQRIVAVDSFAPHTVPYIEIEPYEIEKKRDESHFRMTEEGDDDSEPGDDDRRKKRYRCSDVRFQGFECRIAEAATDHDDGELTETQIQKDLILVLYLYWDLVLHRDIIELEWYRNRLYRIFDKTAIFFVFFF